MACAVGLFAGSGSCTAHEVAQGRQYRMGQPLAGAVLRCNHTGHFAESRFPLAMRLAPGECGCAAAHPVEW
jgi:hypothetical protein